MFTFHHIPQILSSLITEVALTQPVAYISHILFFRNGILVANCDWERPDGRDVIILDENQPAYITLHKNFDNFTDIEVMAIDDQGRELRFKPAPATFKNRDIYSTFHT